jgi:hypothetical protein
MDADIYLDQIFNRDLYLYWVKKKFPKLDLEKTIFLFGDWSQRRGVSYLVNDGSAFGLAKSLEEVVEQESRPGYYLVLIVETTFESFYRDESGELVRRSDLIRRCDAGEFLINTIENKMTGRWRKALGFPDSPKPDTYTGDENDVLVIRHIATQTKHELHRPQITDPAWVQKRKQVGEEIMRLRANVTLKDRPRSRGFVPTSAKDELAERWAQELPPVESLTDTQKLALTDGKKWNLPTVAAVGVAAKYSENRQEFDRLAGLYGNAYGSQIRASLHFDNWTGGSTRAKLVLDPSAPKKRPVLPVRRVDGLTMSAWRRELRWLYHMLRPVVQEVALHGR